MNIKKLATSVIAVLMMLGSMNVLNASAAVSTEYGDVNGDGKINIFDEIYVKQYILGQADSFPVTNWRVSADVTRDNVVNASDLSVIHDYLMSRRKTPLSEHKISTFNGIDVSKWQGKIDWNSVSKCGIDFVMIKAGEGTEIEVNFKDNIKYAKAAGIQCGVYWFGVAKSISDAHAEAKACINAISQYKLEYPVAYDFEYRSLNDNPLSGNRALTTDVMIAFMTDVHSAGYYSMMYSNKDFPERYLEMPRLTSAFDLWYARYTHNPALTPDMRCGIWQYSNKGVVGGIDPVVDLNISFCDYLSVMKEKGLNGY